MFYVLFCNISSESLHMNHQLSLFGIWIERLSYACNLDFLARVWHSHLLICDGLWSNTLAMHTNTQNTQCRLTKRIPNGTVIIYATKQLIDIKLFNNVPRSEKRSPEWRTARAETCTTTGPPASAHRYPLRRRPHSSATHHKHGLFLLSNLFLSTSSPIRF